MSNAISYAAQAASVAIKLVEAKGHDDKATSLRDNANKEMAVMHKAKVVVGRYGTCATATSFVDTLVGAGWAKKTAQNYLSLFKEAVKTGKPVTDWGGTKAGGRKAVKGKAPKQERENPALDALFKMIKADEGLDILAAIEIAYDDDEGSITEIVIEMLKAEGYKVE
jgi:hypothetical protein